MPIDTTRVRNFAGFEDTELVGVARISRNMIWPLFLLLIDNVP